MTEHLDAWAELVRLEIGRFACDLGRDARSGEAHDLEELARAGLELGDDPADRGVEIDDGIRRLRAERPSQQRVEEEGEALRLQSEGSHPRGIEARAGDVPRELLRLVQRERPDFDALARIEDAHERLVGLRRRTRGEHEQARRSGRASHELREQTEAVFVGPLQIVDDDHGRPSTRDVPEERA